MEADASKAIEGFEKDEELQKQLRNWRQNKKSAKKDGPESAKDDDGDEEEDEAAASKVVEQVLAEAALGVDEDDDDDGGIDDRIPAPPSKNLVRQIKRAINLSDSENVSFFSSYRSSH